MTVYRHKKNKNFYHIYIGRRGELQVEGLNKNSIELRQVLKPTKNFHYKDLDDFEVAWTD